MNGYNKYHNNNRMEYDEQRDNFDLDFGFKQYDNPAPEPSSERYGNNDFNNIFPEVPFDKKINYQTSEEPGKEVVTVPAANGKPKKLPPTPAIAYKILLTGYGIMVAACIVLAVIGEAWAFCALVPIMSFTFQFFYLVHPTKRTTPAIASVFFEAAAITAVYYLRMTYPDNFKAMSRNFIGSFFGIGASCAGTALIIGGIASEIISSKRCKTMIECICTGIDRNVHHTHKSHTHTSSTYYSYHPVYEFDFEGAHYKVTGGSLGDKEENPKNKSFMLLIDPENPRRFYEMKKKDNQYKKKSSAGGMIIICFIGLFFAVAGAFVFSLTLDPGLDIMAK